MKVSLLPGTGIYLPDPQDAAEAVWGFVVWSNDSNPPQSWDLAESWNLNAGYYVFFPAADRGSSWKQFVEKLTDQMRAGTNRRFGFFDKDGSGLGFLSVSGSGTSQALTIGHDFAFRNLTLSVTPFGTKVPVTYDSAHQRFVISKIEGGLHGSVAWLAASPGGVAATVIPDGDLYIPVTGSTPGTLQTMLTFSPSDQAAFQTGPMYFGPSGSDIMALRYPTFLDDAIALTAYADPACPLTFDRTFFELPQRELKTGFATNAGRQVSLEQLADSSASSELSPRFVLASRPGSGQQQAYYLTPLGSFRVRQSGTGHSGELICGYSATETLSFNTGDTLRFAPGQPAWLEAKSEGSGTDPVYLSDQYTTSWLGLASGVAQTTYFSQPQSSPIYADDGQTGGGHNLAYKLKYKLIPAWPPQGSAADGAAPEATPLIPMAPYGGTAPGDQAAAYKVMETKGLNPERRHVLRNATPHQSFSPLIDATAASLTADLTYSMTPLGLIGGFDANNLWTSTRFAVSGPDMSDIVQFQNMGDAIRTAFYQNQVFLVMDRNRVTETDQSTETLFTFDKSDATVDLADWFFDLRLQGNNPEGVPPIILVKLFRDKSLKELVADQSYWTQATVFSSDPQSRQAEIQKIFDDAEAAVKVDPNSVYADFVEKISDPAFTGLIALNTALDLEALPAIIRALLGGMTKPDGTSNIAAFRAHHVGVMISDTGNNAGVELDSSSIFALVDYQDSSTTNLSLQTRTELGQAALSTLPDSIYPCGTNGLQCYGFKVIYLRALFSNNALTSFSSEVDLKVNNLFAVGVNLGNDAAGTDSADGDNTIKISGSYSEHDGNQTYSFVAKKTYEFTFKENTYLKKITFDKVQFSSTDDENVNGESTSRIGSRFAIWGSIEFNKLEFLDMFSFKKLSFADLGIEMSYLLTLPGGGKDPETSDLAMKFSPGNLRFDFGDTEQRNDDDSLLALLPFKLKSFLYSEKGQAISELDYFAIDLSSFGGSAATTSPEFNFALIFDLDLGSLGGLVGSLSAFKFSVILGWQPPGSGGGLVFGLQMPEADGKLELNIEGVLKISIEDFQLKYTNDTTDKLLVLVLHKSYMELLGTRIPPGDLFFDLALFAPTKGEDKIGWIAALNADAGDQDSDEPRQIGVSMEGPLQAVRQAAPPENGDTGGNAGEEGSKLLKLDYFGIGQRVGPEKNLTNFDAFLAFMKDDFWKAVKAEKYGEVYKPDGGWIVVSHTELLELINLGFVFYDSTPFYSLKIYIAKGSVKGLSFEITYTKVSDDVGLFFIDFSLPDSLRTFQAGAASITMPALKLSIYTNGNFKVDLGFPANSDWSVSFRVQAFAGPVPLTGSGGFYIALLSSATDKVFKADNYDTILAAGFGARIGVGKDFTAGPLKAGVSLTFFGIIEGAIGYYAYDSKNEDVVKWLTDPKALSLTGQFGVIGELYGTVDFAIIKASVNVNIGASVGVQLILEEGLGGDILLYVEAFLTVSASVKISLGFFSIKISFSFKANFRFEWKLLDNRSSTAFEQLRFQAQMAALVADSWNPKFPLQSGLNPKLSAWMVPEFTTVWSDPKAVGAPWFAVSLAMEYLDDPSAASEAEFMPFETIAAQLVAWALNTSLQLSDWSAEVTQKQIDCLNQRPDLLVGGLDYATLLEGLGNMFMLSVDGIPEDDGLTANEDKAVKHAAIFPMLPFLGLKTTGRDNELDYRFEDKSRVLESWVMGELQTYFEQLYTNITAGSGDAAASVELDDARIALTQSLFLDWFQAAIRSTLNALLTQMQNDGTEKGALSEIYLAAVKSGQIRTVAGQMSQFFRSGLRLPASDGMTVPDGSLQPTNPLYALIWQEFPVGSKLAYDVELYGNEAQKWVSVDAKWSILEKDVTPYAIDGNKVPMPGSPQVAPVLQTAPQAFSLSNPVTWTPGASTPVTLRPLPGSLLDAIKSSASLSVAVKTRTTGEAYDNNTASVPNNDVRWALSVPMTVRKVPAGGTGKFLPDTFALGAADLTVQNAMRNLLQAMRDVPDLVTGIRLLYQEARDEAGLISVDSPEQLFVLRTNTTTQSVPPPEALAAIGRPPTEVGADTSDPFGFLQILEQSSVTNQTGYFVTYIDDAGKSLPEALFGNQTVAQVTFLFELKVTESTGAYALKRFVNAAVLANTEVGKLYYVETTRPEDEKPFVSTAAGAVGVEFTRTEPGDNSVVDQLANLYSYVAFQVPGSNGFIASNLSVPGGPQKLDETDITQTWRLFAPVYKLATDNQGVADPNRYSSIGDSYSVQSLVVDAFGNAFGAPVDTVTDRQNLFFDDLIGVGTWTGVRAMFDFHAWSDPTDDTICGSVDDGVLASGGDPKLDTLSVYLCPSTQSLPEPGTDAAITTAALYQTILNQLTASGPDGKATTQMFVTTNLDSAHSDLDLSQVQTKAVVDMLRGIKSYLEGAQQTDPGGVSLTVTLPAKADSLPLVFSIQVGFGLRRTRYVSPEVEGYAAAHRVTTNVPPPSGAGLLPELARDFSTAFPGFSLATGPADAASVVVGGENVVSDEAASASQPKGLWAVSRKVTSLSIGTTERQYLAPKPLGTQLRSGTVPMPSDLPGLGSLPASQTVSDVDMDSLARSVFSAIDLALGAENASNLFRLAPEAYRQIAVARENIADRYADNEVEWLLDDPRYQGTSEDLCQGQDQLAQQMRQALGSAYAVNTIVQARVTFKDPLPASMGNRLQLFGQMQRSGADTQANAGGFGLGTARVDVPAGAGGQSVTTSFLYGVTDQKIEQERYQTLDLEWAVSHLQVFLEDREIDYCDHGETAPPSIWLQFIDTFNAPPEMGETEIPLAFREYPTPPTMVGQNWSVDQEHAASTLADLTRWVYTSTYQARLLKRDEITLNLMYNLGGAVAQNLDGKSMADSSRFNLFEALVRFRAGYGELQAQLNPITDNTPKDVLGSFATLVSQLANNTDWVPAAGTIEAATGPVFTLERDVVTDVAIGDKGARQINLEPDPLVSGENPWIGSKCINALDPATMQPYAGEIETCSSAGERKVTHSYTPDPALEGNFVTHQIKVKGLTTLKYENANSGIGTRRNANLFSDPKVFSNPSFVYQTPIVTLTNPIRPFVDNPIPFEIYPNIVAERDQDLGCYILQTLKAMMGLIESADALLAAAAAEGEQAPLTHRRLKIEARFGFPLVPPARQDDPPVDFLPLSPAVLVRSFELPVDGLEQALTEWVGLSSGAAENLLQPYAKVLYDWLQGAGMVFGDPANPDAPPDGAFLSLDVTLYSQLSSGTNRQPLLRLSDLRLALQIIAKAGANKM